jgi:hypothetical protein
MAHHLSIDVQHYQHQYFLLRDSNFPQLRKFPVDLQASLVHPSAAASVPAPANPQMSAD